MRIFVGLLIILRLCGCQPSLEERLQPRLVESDPVGQGTIRLGMTTTAVVAVLGEHQLSRLNYHLGARCIAQWRYYSVQAYSDFQMEEDDIGIEAPHAGPHERVRLDRVLVFLDDRLVEIHDLVNQRHLVATDVIADQDEQVQRTLRQLREMLPR